jgi:hypothetical protein
MRAGGRSKGKQTRRFFSNLVASVWLFPGLLICLLFVLTILKISGSSVGVYYQKFYGPRKDTNIIANEPRAIRSDEWLFTTQMTIAQSKAGFPRVNHNIEYGRDMSLVGDAPYKDWTAVFRPQNLAFLVLPLEFAFAFKWWLLLVLTIISGYFLVLRALPTKRLLASILSSAFAFSPFLFWWYQTATLAPIFYGFFIILLGIRIINYEKISLFKKRRWRYSLIAYGLLLAYLLTSFALILYPPFQIPIAIVVTLFLAGFILDQYGWRRLLSRSNLINITVFIVSIIASLALVLGFVGTRNQAVKAVENTVYPGSRHVASGGEVLVNELSFFLQPELQDQTHAEHNYANQSEASNFLLLSPFLLLPSIALIYIKFRLKHRINLSFLAIQLCIIIFLGDLFFDKFQLAYNLLHLDIVPAARLRIGLGFAGFIQLIYFIKIYESIKLDKRYFAFAGAYSVACLWVLLKVGQSFRHHYPLFVNSKTTIIFLALMFALIIFCLLIKRFLLGAVILLVFSLACVIHIHPLYRGLQPLYNSRLTQTIESVSRPGSTWVSVDDITLENIPAMSNRNSLSGIQLYPDINFWRKVDGKKDDYIYNRYAHAMFSTDPKINKIQLVQLDSFEVRLSCEPFLLDHVQFVLSGQPLDQPCLHQTNTVQYPNSTFYIYKVY